jgi:putative SOS response-associated peptidase YedK
VEQDREIEAAITVSKSTKASCSLSQGFGIARKNASGKTVETCSILTRTPNAVTAVVRDRMPLILDLDSYDLRLAAGMKDVGLVFELLKAFNARIMRSYPLSTRVNQVVINSDDEECLAPVQPVQTHSQLRF